MIKASIWFSSAVLSVFCFFVWFLLYITLRFLPWFFPAVTSEDIDMAHIVLNVTMATIVAIYSIRDRFKAFEQSGYRFINQFYPLGFAIFPLSAVLWDLAEKLNDHYIGVSLIFLMLSAVCIMETAFLCEDQEREPIINVKYFPWLKMRLFYWRFISHLFLAASLMLASIVVVYQKERVNHYFDLPAEQKALSSATAA